MRLLLRRRGVSAGGWQALFWWRMKMARSRVRVAMRGCPAVRFAGESWFGVRAMDGSGFHPPFRRMSKSGCPFLLEEGGEGHRPARMCGVPGLPCFARRECRVDFVLPQRGAVRRWGREGVRWMFSGVVQAMSQRGCRECSAVAADQGMLRFFCVEGRGGRRSSEGGGRFVLVLRGR